MLAYNTTTFKKRTGIGFVYISHNQKERKAKKRKKALCFWWCCPRWTLSTSSRVVASEPLCPLFETITSPRLLLGPGFWVPSPLYPCSRDVAPHCLTWHGLAPFRHIYARVGHDPIYMACSRPVSAYICPSWPWSNFLQSWNLFLSCLMDLGRLKWCTW